MIRLIKKINNNYALALDSRQETIIVEGKGIGFIKMPCDLEDLSKIARTYYDITEQDVSLIQSVSDEVMEISSIVSRYASHRISDKINPNLTFILADHIQFCIERLQKGIQIKMPIYYDIEYLYPVESEIAEYAMKLIRERKTITLPESEKTGIALNIINSELFTDSKEKLAEDLIESCTHIIESHMNIKIDRTSFSYSRYVTHMEYFIRRANGLDTFSTVNGDLYEPVSRDYPEIEKIVLEIEKYINTKGYSLHDEEKLYLILHINRLCNREDCNL